MPMTEHAKGIGGRIKRLRKQRGLTVAQCIEQGGPAHWFDIEAGRNPPSLESLRRIAAALGCEAAELLTTEGTEGAEEPGAGNQ